MSADLAPRELVHFLLLTPTEQATAICRLASQGWSEYGLAQACRLSVEMVRRILGSHHSVTTEGARTALTESTHAYFCDQQERRS